MRAALLYNRPQGSPKIILVILVDWPVGQHLSTHWPAREWDASGVQSEPGMHTSLLRGESEGPWVRGT